MVDPLRVSGGENFGVCGTLALTIKPFFCLFWYPFLTAGSTRRVASDPRCGRARDILGRA